MKNTATSEKPSREHAAIASILENPVTAETQSEESAEDLLTEDEEEDQEETATEAEESEEQESEEESEDEESEEETEEDTEEEETEESELIIPDWDPQLREFFPDREFNSNADYQAATGEMIQAMLEHRQAEEAANETLVSVFNDHPSILQAVQLLTKGYSDVAAFAMAGIIPEDMVPEEDKNYKEVLKANLKREEAKKAAEVNRKKLEENAKRSQDVITNWKRKKGLSDAEYKEYETKVEQFINHFINAEMTEEIADFLYDGFYSKKLQSKAEDKGRVQGRNEKITIGKKKKVGDGLPKLSGTMSAKKSEVKYADPFVEALDKAAKAN